MIMAGWSSLSGQTVSDKINIVLRLGHFLFNSANCQMQNVKNKLVTPIDLF
jgi:hypothetical protein